MHRSSEKAEQVHRSRIGFDMLGRLIEGSELQFAGLCKWWGTMQETTTFSNHLCTPTALPERFSVQFCLPGEAIFPHSRSKWKYSLLAKEAPLRPSRANSPVLLPYRPTAPHSASVVLTY